MSTLTLPKRRNPESLILPGLTPSTTASSSQAMSRATSLSGQDSRRLSFRGQMIKVILPAEVPQASIYNEDIAEKVSSIHQLDEGDV
jgi:hypothetical protein